MLRNDRDLPGAKPRRTRRLTRAARLLNVLGYAALLGVVLLLVDRLDESQAANENLERSLSRQRKRIEEAQREAFEAIRRVEARALADLDSTRRSIQAATSESTASTLQRSRRLLDKLASREEAARRSLEKGQLEIAAELKSQISRLRRDLEKRTERVPDVEELFRGIQERWDRSLVLIHSRFTYFTLNEEGEREARTGSGWGTGFFVTDEGHIITNKHVVQPWKFDSELCAMASLGEVEVRPESLRLAAWPTGTRCLDEKRELVLDNGFNNGRLDNLELVATAPDHMTERSLDLGPTSFAYPMHALDNNDLALLKAEPGDAALAPLELLGPDVSAPRKLDVVMALGFPRGQNGLERGVVVTSPSLGTVRKVEETIHVTASIIPGNSGGPLFDEHGRVVGIATRIYSETYGICIKVGHVHELLESALRDAREPEPSKASPSPAVMASTAPDHR